MSKKIQAPDFDDECFACAGFGMVKGTTCWVCGGSGVEPEDWGEEEDEDDDDDDDWDDD